MGRDYFSIVDNSANIYRALAHRQVGPRQLLDFTIENRIKGIVIWITTVQKFKVQGSMCTPENLDALCGFADVGDFQRAHRQWVGEILREGRTVRDDRWSESIEAMASGSDFYELTILKGIDMHLRHGPPTTTIRRRGALSRHRARQPATEDLHFG
jgi:hypothetical protein